MFSRNRFSRVCRSGIIASKRAPAAFEMRMILRMIVSYRLAARGKTPCWRGPMGYAADRVTNAESCGHKTAGILADLKANAAARNLAHKPTTRAARRRSASAVRP